MACWGCGRPSLPARRRISSIVEGLFFTLFGGLLIYVLYAGVEQVQQAIQIVGWSAIAGGVILAGLSFYNRSRDADRDQAADQAQDAAQQVQATVHDAGDRDDAAAVGDDAPNNPDAPGGQ